jgi:hypothetical protein
MSYFMAQNELLLGSSEFSTFYGKNELIFYFFFAFPTTLFSPVTTYYFLPFTYYFHKSPAKLGNSEEVRGKK